jgi:hypothetical protein
MKNQDETHAWSQDVLTVNYPEPVKNE